MGKFLEQWEGFSLTDTSKRLGCPDQQGRVWKEGKRFFEGQLDRKVQLRENIGNNTLTIYLIELSKINTNRIRERLFRDQIQNGMKIS